MKQKGSGLSIFLYVFLIPFLSSIIYLILTMFGIVSLDNPLGFISFIVVTLLLDIVFQKTATRKAIVVTGAWALIAAAAAVILMILGGGGFETSRMQLFHVFTFPYFLLNGAFSLSGKMAASVLFGIAGMYITHIFLLLKNRKHIRKRVVLVYSVVSIALCGVLAGGYMIRPEKKYGGHGFAYMNGWSSTDFKDYHVYSDNSKLAVLDHESSVKITESFPVMDGAEACYPLYASIANAVYENIGEIEKENQREYENVNGRYVSFTNTVQGFYRLLEGEVDLLFGARPSREQLEIAQMDQKELQITPIGKEGFVFFVEEDNPVTNLTSDQIKAIYHGDITNWKEVGGRDQEIRAFQRPANSGSQAMMEYFMGDVSLKEPLQYERVSSMEGVIHEVAQYANEEGAFGYSFRYFVEGLNQEKGVRIISVDGVSPTQENISNGSFPLVVDLCLTTLKDTENPHVQEMIDFVLSADGQELVEKTGYSRLH